VIPLIYRVLSSNDDFSINRLEKAFECVIGKHSVLRTSIHFDPNGFLIQQILENKRFQFSIIKINKDENENILIDKIINQSDLFDLSKGRVINCSLIKHSSIDNDLLLKDDLILINIHHSAFDGISQSIFIKDLTIAYQTNCLLNEGIEYIDYSIYEHQLDMNLSKDFWSSEFEGCHLENPLLFPFDRHRLITDQRSGFSSVVEISLDNEICKSLIEYSYLNQMTIFQISLSIFYLFLFKLTLNTNDICISCLNGNRYRNELEYLIGMFASTLPYRIQLDSNYSFNQLVKHVQDKCLAIIQHSNYPLQHILSHFHLNQSNLPFLETLFDLIIVTQDENHLSLDGNYLEQVPLEQSSEAAKFDFRLTFIYNPELDNQNLSCRFICSRDLFDDTTVTNIANRFNHILYQLFSSNSNAIQNNQTINKFSIILPQDIQQTVFHRLANISNEGIYILYSHSSLNQ
jgi:NRPS condensation-like uncharacterized protein